MHTLATSTDADATILVLVLVVVVLLVAMAIAYCGLDSAKYDTNELKRRVKALEEKSK